MNSRQMSTLKALDIIAIVLGIVELLIIPFILILGRDMNAKYLFTGLAFITFILVINSFKNIKNEAR